ncbi:MAG: D-alanyl-D-alanine carboxypeptidase [Oscillospiraceae bacterium]|nr:D-alanyl-D-alanine carboxypeptidase [Oscillospiraceae bacterium]
MKRILSAILVFALLVIPVSAAPKIDAPAALLMEKDSGKVLHETNSHDRRPPASVTKVMTLLLIMEALSSGQLTPDTPISVSATAAGMGGSQVYLAEGEQMSVHEMLKSIAVSSANDACVAMAEHLAGSEEHFVEQMNARAAQLGMTDTHFVNCTGLPADDHYSSAHDIALMSRRLILDHPDIRTYTTIWMDSIRDGAFGLSNTNRLIRFYPGATGLKTGFTDTALYCLSATAERDGMELIAVVLGAPTSEARFETAKSLLDYGFANFALTDVYPDAPLPPIPVLLGQSDYVQPQLERSCRLLLPRSSTGNVTTELTLAQDVQAPVELGQRLGTMQVLVDGVLQETIPIVASSAVERHSFPNLFLQLLRHLFMASH